MRFTPLHLQQLNAVVFAIADVNVSAVDEHAVRARLPIVQEIFYRTLRVVDGENVVYIDSTLENELGFDRTVS